MYTVPSLTQALSAMRGLGGREGRHCWPYHSSFTSRVFPRVDQEAVVLTSRGVRYLARQSDWCAAHPNRKHDPSGQCPCKRLFLYCFYAPGCGESEGGPRGTSKATIRPSSDHPQLRFGPTAGLPFPCPAQMSAESVSLDRN